MRIHTFSEASKSRSQRSPISSTFFSTLAAVLLLSPSLTAAFECSDIQAQNQKFNLEPLGGPKIVRWLNPEQDFEAGFQFNYTFTIDLCKKLKWHKDGSLQTECHHGTRICAIKENIPLDESANRTIQPIEIAGTYTTDAHRSIDARFELLRNSKSHSDSDREGLRAELHGGRFPFSGSKGIDQMAIIEFVCDKDRDGSEEGEEDNSEKERDDGNKEGEKLRKRDENSNDKCENTNASLRFCGYKKEQRDKGKDAQVLRLEWRTKYACEDAPDVSGSHWGFFTWFIIILFLAIAAYLIFGSWLNYNRYGARGWDLLPHGDTIRDIPYILKDWARHVANTVQGPGSRGGYSAV